MFCLAVGGHGMGGAPFPRGSIAPRPVFGFKKHRSNTSISSQTFKPQIVPLPRPATCFYWCDLLTSSFVIPCDCGWILNAVEDESDWSPRRRHESQLPEAFKWPCQQQSGLTDRSSRWVHVLALKGKTASMFFFCFFLMSTCCALYSKY